MNDHREDGDDAGVGVMRLERGGKWHKRAQNLLCVRHLELRIPDSVVAKAWTDGSPPHLQLMFCPDLSRFHFMFEASGGLFK